MEMAPTWIDAGMAREWQCRRSARLDLTDRWFVFLDESWSAFIVQSGNAGHGSFGGDDSCYDAKEAASAIERWAKPNAGLETGSAFFEALERDLRLAETAGTPLDIVRAKYLLQAMRARAAMAKSADEPPFTDFGKGQPLDLEDASYLSAREAGFGG